MAEIGSSLLKTCKRCNHTRENEMFRKHRSICRICNNEADAKNRQKKKLQMQEDFRMDVVQTCKECNRPQKANKANMFGIGRLVCNDCFNKCRRERYEEQQFNKIFVSNFGDFDVTSKSCKKAAASKKPRTRIKTEAYKVKDAEYHKKSYTIFKRRQKYPAERQAYRKKKKTAKDSHVTTPKRKKKCRWHKQPISSCNLCKKFEQFCAQQVLDM